MSQVKSKMMKKIYHMLNTKRKTAGVATFIYVKIMLSYCFKLLFIHLF